VLLFRLAPILVFASVSLCFFRCLSSPGYAGDITAMQLMESNWQPPPADVHGVAFTVPTQVNYVGKAMRLAPHPEDLGGSTSVIDSIVRTTWLWNTVRVSVRPGTLRVG